MAGDIKLAIFAAPVLSGVKEGIPVAEDWGVGGWAMAEFMAAVWSNKG
jgi:hypothetical protein